MSYYKQQQVKHIKILLHEIESRYYIYVCGQEISAYEDWRVISDKRSLSLTLKPSCTNVVQI